MFNRIKCLSEKSAREELKNRDAIGMGILINTLKYNSLDQSFLIDSIFIDSYIELLEKEILYGASRESIAGIR